MLFKTLTLLAEPTGFTTPRKPYFPVMQLPNCTIQVFFSLAILAMISACGERDTDQIKQTLLEKLVLENDKSLQTYLSRQNLDRGDINHGGFPNADGIYNPGSAAAILQRMTAAYLSEGSSFNKETDLISRMELAMDFLMTRQHEDGTIDLLTTNFHSTPDLAFAIEPAALSFKLLEQQNLAESKQLRQKLQRFLLLGGEALIVGGIHTPNHRWVVCMALARLYELFPYERYVNRINTWLNEGIDIDPDGQYTERSTAVYSPLTNRCLVTIARILNREELYEPVRKNLEMSIYYIHPNWEVVTEASRRQDQYRAQTPHAYYYPYRYMSLHDNNALFGAMVNGLEESIEPSRLSGNLIYLLEDTALQNEVPAKTLPTIYEKHFLHSDLVRIRQEETDATVLGKNAALFTMQKEDAVLQAVRLASAFFGKGQFRADTLYFSGDTIRLLQELEGPYYQPYPVDSLPDDGDWEKMPRENRPQSEIQYLTTNVDIVREGSSFLLHFKIAGTDNVPVALELAFRKGGKLNGVSPKPDEDDSFFLTESEASYAIGRSSITFGPGLQAHQWTQLRGADAKLDALSVYLTGYTPFVHTLRLK